MKTKFKFSTILIALALLVNSFAVNVSEIITNTDPEKDKILVYVLKNISSVNN